MKNIYCIINYNNNKIEYCLLNIIDSKITFTLDVVNDNEFNVSYNLKDFNKKMVLNRFYGRLSERKTKMLIDSYICDYDLVDENEFNTIVKKIQMLL